MNKNSHSHDFILDIQNNLLINHSFYLPTLIDINRFVQAVFLHEQLVASELTLRLVDEPEMQSLNHHYRGKNYPTNVLSFPSNIPKEVELEVPFLGDIVLCVPVIEREAIEQSLTISAHWAHMIVHGLLHLLGYDHENEEDAELMEAKEIILLNNLGIDNPYDDTEV